MAGQLSRDSHRRRHLPVVRWLQAGAVAAGVGVALVSAPGSAEADDGGDSVSADTVTARSTVQTERRPVARRGFAGLASRSGAETDGGQVESRSAAARQQRADAGQPLRASATVRPTGSDSAASDWAASDWAASDSATSDTATQPWTDTGSEPPPAVAASAVATTARSGGATVTTLTPAAAGNGPAALAVTQPAAVAQFDPFGQVAAFFGLPGAPATSAPSLGALPILLRLTLEDLVSGTGPATVTNPTAVVTGLFNQVLRADPTADEMQNYLAVLSLTGVNGVTAGLYSSTAFRQTEVNSYYLELLNRNATAPELAWDTSALMWGTPEPLFAARIAGSQAFYQSSSAGGGSAGAQPSAFSYVDNLYRSLLGTPADPAVAAAYIQQLNSGLPISMAALQFVTTDTFRAAKVQEIYSVLGQSATQAQVESAVQNWFLDGGLAGIATSLLATSANVTRIETGQVALPDTVAAAQLQEILLAAYTSTEEGFVKTLNRLLNVDDQNPCPTSPSCNVALYTLLTSGGPDRGLANSALTITYGSADVADMVPTQNEIDLAKTLKNTLQDPASIQTFFDGGVITPFGDAPVITADDGTYIVDGHHRWSAIYLINPYAQVITVDVGYVPNPQAALKETQIGIVAQLGYLKVSPGGGINVYTVDRTVFNVEVNGWITTGDKKDEVLAVFRENLGIPDSATEAEQLHAIDNYVWTNVERMRALNPYIPGATNREVMPQAGPLTPILAYMGSGLLSYSFPTISYLG